ncbi:MAG: hypothetical protein ACRD2T_15475, partial [Thermoanaerobaculia bacterium]
MSRHLDLVEQERGQNIWTIVELFYRSHAVFREQYNRYEERVLHYSKEMGLHRLDLRLNPEDLAGLLDLKALERLRDGYLQELKDLCHQVFRGQDRTDLLDRYVSDIFHEMSILKEEHYNVKTYAPQYARDAAEVELKYILDEAHGLFPQKLNQIRFLFGKAQARMEELLPTFRKLKIFVRTLYLSRDDFVRETYEDGIRHFYRCIYPDGGAVEGFYEAGRTFHEAGFLPQALEAYRLAQA